MATRWLVVLCGCHSPHLHIKVNAVEFDYVSTNSEWWQQPKCVCVGVYAMQVVAKLINSGRDKNECGTYWNRQHIISYRLALKRHRTNKMKKMEKKIEMMIFRYEAIELVVVAFDCLLTSSLLPSRFLSGTRVNIKTDTLAAECRYQYANGLPLHKLALRAVWTVRRTTQTPLCDQKCRYGVQTKIHKSGCHPNQLHIRVSGSCSFFYYLFVQTVNEWTNPSIG